MKSTTKHASNNPLAVLLFLPSCCINSLLFNRYSAVNLTLFTRASLWASSQLDCVGRGEKREGRICSQVSGIWNPPPVLPVATTLKNPLLWQPPWLKKSTWCWWVTELQKLHILIVISYLQKCCIAFWGPFQKRDMHKKAVSLPFSLWERFHLSKNLISQGLWSLVPNLCSWVTSKS